MNRRAALLDANVMYPAPLRDLMIQLATTGLFRARWTDDIHSEWIDALLRNQPWRDPASLDRTRQLMDRAVRDCLITDYRRLIPSMQLPDPKDRHVLAAAIVGECDLIVTFNLADFPAKDLSAFGIEARHPDDFLFRQLRRVPNEFCRSVLKVQARLVSPSVSLDEYLDTLHRQGLTTTIAELRSYSTLLRDASDEPP